MTQRTQKWLRGLASAWHPHELRGRLKRNAKDWHRNPPAGAPRSGGSVRRLTHGSQTLPCAAQRGLSQTATAPVRTDSVPTTETAPAKTDRHHPTSQRHARRAARAAARGTTDLSRR
eukprot:3190069-Rhodomonas_salina.2